MEGKKEELMHKSLLYRPLLDKSTNENRIIHLIDNDLIRRLLFGSPPLETSDQVPSVSANARPTNRFVDRTTVVETSKKRCPNCLYDFNNYALHEHKKIESGCCLCRTKFDSHEELRDHLLKFAANFLCCICGTYQCDDEEKYYRHVKNYCYYKNKK